MANPINIRPISESELFEAMTQNTANHPSTQVALVNAFASGPSFDTRVNAVAQRTLRNQMLYQQRLNNPSLPNPPLGPDLLEGLSWYEKLIVKMGMNGPWCDAIRADLIDRKQRRAEEIEDESESFFLISDQEASQLGRGVEVIVPSTSPLNTQQQPLRPVDLTRPIYIYPNTLRKERNMTSNVQNNNRPTICAPQQNESEQPSKPPQVILNFLEYPKSELMHAEFIDFAEVHTQGEIQEKLVEIMKKTGLSAQEILKRVEDARLPGNVGSKVETVCYRLAEREEMDRRTQMAAQAISQANAKSEHSERVAQEATERAERAEALNAQIAWQGVQEAARLQRGQEETQSALQRSEAQRYQEDLQNQRVISSLCSELQQTRLESTQARHESRISQQTVNALQLKDQMREAKKAEVLMRQQAEKAAAEAQKAKIRNQLEGSAKVIGLTLGGGLGLGLVGGGAMAAPYASIPLMAAGTAGGIAAGTTVLGVVIGEAKVLAEEIGDQLKGIDIHSAGYKEAKQQERISRQVREGLRNGETVRRVEVESELIDLAPERENPPTLW